MPNLIDQMNILKGLSDQQLGTELQQPSGAVPPYLVVSELSRRKDMRQRYTGQEALRRPQTTVAQDALSSIAPMPPMGAPSAPGGAAPPGGMPMAPGAAPGAMGIAAAPPMPANPSGYARGGIVGYADGGVVNLQMPPGSPGIDPAADPANYGYLSPDIAPPDVGAAFNGADAGANGTAAAVNAQTSAPLDPGYAGIAARVEQQLDQEARTRAQAPWLGLLQGGLAVAGGTSPNALTNIGTGAQTGVDAYKAAIQGADSGASTDLNNLAALQTATQDYQFKKQAADLDAQKFAASQNPNSPQNTPQLMRSLQMVNAMPEGPAKDAATAMVQPAALQAVQQKKDMAHDLAEQVYAGELDPNLPRQYSMTPYVEADLGQNHPGFNLIQAQQEANAANANIRSMNATGQLRLRQNIGELTGPDGASGMLGQLQKVADAWNAGGFGPINGATLYAASQGYLGEDARAKAALFKSQLADAGPAMSSVFSGGNSPTDKMLANAQSIFDDNQSKVTFDQLIQQARLNLGYRARALDQAPAGPAGNRYNFSGTGATPGTPTAPPTMSGAAAETAPTAPVDYRSYFGAQ